MIPKTKARLTDAIYGKKHQEELGYIIDVPGFFVEKDKLTELDRVKMLENLVYVLQKNNISILVFPLWRKFISPNERYYIEGNAITLLDGSLMRLVSLMATVEKLLGILKTKPGEMEVGVWGADNSVGQLWVEFLAPYLNYLSIGGNDLTVLEHLSDKILYDTGLSCQVTTDPNQCLKDKHMIILGTMPQEWDSSHRSEIAIFSCGLSHEYYFIQQSGVSGMLIESGWPTFNQDLAISNDLEPWDKIGALEANLFIMDELYRDILMNYPLNLKNIKKIEEILIKYSVKYNGMVSNNEILTYDGFRRVYFGNYLDK